VALVIIYKTDSTLPWCVVRFDVTVYFVSYDVDFQVGVPHQHPSGNGVRLILRDAVRYHWYKRNPPRFHSSKMMSAFQALSSEV